MPATPIREFRLNQSGLYLVTYTVELPNVSGAAVTFDLLQNNTALPEARTRVQIDGGRQELVGQSILLAAADDFLELQHDSGMVSWSSTGMAYGISNVRIGD